MKDQDYLSHWDRRKFLKTTASILLSTPLWGSPWKPFGANSWIPAETILNSLPERIRDNGFTALSLAVLENGGEVWQHVVNLESNGDGEEPLFEAGSLAKPMAAVAALQLRQRGLLDFDRPLMEYYALEELQNVPGASTITVRHVLSHSSGLQNWRFSANDKLTLRFQPGEGFGYSGEGYVWLQRVMEKLTGMGYARYVQDHIFNPLNMSRSSFAYRKSLFEQMPPGYKKDGTRGDNYGARIGAAMQAIAESEQTDLDSWTFDKVTAEYPEIEANLPPLPVFLSPNAAGSLVTSASDYIKFLKVMINDQGEKLSVDASLQKTLFTPTSQVGPYIHWGLGWGLESVNNRTLSFHTCETRFFKGMALMDRQGRKALVVLTNGANGDAVYDPLVRQSTNLELTALDQF